MKYNILVVLLSIILVTTEIQENEKIKVSIYYESLCPFSVQFIVEQLYPAYQKINASLKVDFVPYGNAEHNKTNGTWIFDCQHGPEECWGNKAQACGLNMKKGQDEKVDYIYCMMNQEDPSSTDAVKNCSSKLGVEADTIFSCIDGPLGDELLAKYGDQTHAVKPPIPGVPALAFNDEFDEKISDIATEKFLEVMCLVLPDNTKGCPSKKDIINEVL